ncbi:helix-turn-helix domain-containing protein [Amycolatopsis sp. CA-230715]|uniref:helix-turn-helix domain-containing protein n=1 Tax=Amycolatopsis sp. CA-230715 TaxID=2745196 RepID=UPI001C02FD35|nr:helix-turn-helix transcriptional regulator [Amycolatopsis sp. CA-230715]QWF76984.1 hypothetical protein HUW46_00364 [Amycolatopsis sp. CA-230715]
MTMTESDSTVRAQKLGQSLRVLREQANLNVRAAGARINASASKISRIENGKSFASTEDVSGLLAAYGVVGSKRQHLLDLAAESAERGWWQRHELPIEARVETLSGLEAAANTLVSFEIAVIPGLAQTEEYTRALMIESGVVPRDMVEQRVRERMDRQEALRQRWSPPQMRFILDEFAIHRVIGGREVHCRQLEHLIALSGRRATEVRVVPNAGKAHAGLSGGFLIIQRPEGAPVIFLGNLTSSLVVEGLGEVSEYQKAASELLNHALSPRDSLNFIARKARRLHAGVTQGNQPSLVVGQEQL